MRSLTKVWLGQGHGALLYVAVAAGGLGVQAHLIHAGRHGFPGVMPRSDFLHMTKKRHTHKKKNNH